MLYMSELAKMETEDIIKNIENIAYFGGMELLFTSYIEVNIEKIDNNYKISAWIYDKENEKLQVQNSLTLKDIKDMEVNIEKIDLNKLNEELKEELKEVEKNHNNLYLYGGIVYDKYGNCLVED